MTTYTITAETTDYEVEATGNSYTSKREAIRIARILAKNATKGLYRRFFVEVDEMAIFTVAA